jgi:hypothetical protein
VKRLRRDAGGSRGLQAQTVAQESTGEGRIDRDCGLRPEMFRFGPAAWRMCRAHPNEARVLMHHAAGPKRQISLARPSRACTRPVVPVKESRCSQGGGQSVCSVPVRAYFRFFACLRGEKITPDGVTTNHGDRPCADVRVGRGFGCPEIRTDTADAVRYYCVDSSGGRM